jgi:streptomycin 6-kinase
VAVVSGTRGKIKLIEIPESFLESAARNMPEGQDWLESLPPTLSQCVEKWDLSECTPCDGLGSNFVFIAQSGPFGKVVIKVEGPHNARHAEAAALRVYNGQGACRLYDVYGEDEALLLERVVPGTILKSIADKDEQASVGCDLVASLPRKPPDESTFPSYADWIRTGFGRALRKYDPEPAMVELITEAESCFEEISANTSVRALLHGDLHHENVVKGPDNTWKTIDPQGVIGPPAMECARFIQNHIGDSEVDEFDTALLNETVQLFAEKLKETPRTITLCVFVLDVLSTAWGYDYELPSRTNQIRNQILPKHPNISQQHLALSHPMGEGGRGDRERVKAQCTGVTLPSLPTEHG